MNTNKYPFDGAKWTYRYEAIGKLIKHGLSVLDIGAGDEHIVSYIKPSKYVPVDLHKRTERTVQVDLNKEDLPFEVRMHQFDVVLFQGIFEYITDIPKLLENTYCLSDVMVCTYYEYPKKMDLWVNNYTFVQFEEILAKSGWLLHSKTKLPNNNQNIYICKKRKQYS